MSSVAIPGPATRTSPVGKKRNDADSSPADAGGRSITFRAPSELAADLDDIADALSVDVSNLVRMVLRENLTSYRERAERVRQERAKAKRGD